MFAHVFPSRLRLSETVLWKLQRDFYEKNEVSRNAATHDNDKRQAMKQDEATLKRRCDAAVVLVVWPVTK